MKEPEIDYHLLVSRAEPAERWRAEMEKSQTLREALGAVEFLRLLTNREDDVCQPDTDHARCCQFVLLVRTARMAEAVHAGTITIDQLAMLRDRNEAGRVFNVVRFFPAHRTANKKPE